MIKRDILLKATMLELEEIKNDIDKYGGEVIFVPVRVEGFEGRIGCLTNSNIMRTYNDILRGSKV